MAISVQSVADGARFTGGGNGDTVTFSVVGGRYAVVAHATWSAGNLALQIQAPDGTFVPAMSNMTADGLTIVDLPQGSTCKFVITTATGVTGFCSRVTL